MVYIGATESHGSAIYFDIHAAERHGRNVSVSGTIGDGFYEGEVLVELGQKESVTFADAWLDRAGLTEFLARCAALPLHQALLNAVRDLALLQYRPVPPHVNKPHPAAGRCAETQPRWRRGA